eukprot:926247-Rhodomonas_salina.1
MGSRGGVTGLTAMDISPSGELVVFGDTGPLAPYPSPIPPSYPVPGCPVQYASSYAPSAIFPCSLRYCTMP